MSAVLLALAVVGYQVACTLFWPTPSEAPLLLYPRMPLTVILALCVLGKVLGALAILAGVARVERWVARGPRGVAAARAWLRDRLLRWGFPAYFVMQAVPFMPMRASLYVYAGIARDRRLVVLGIAVGTVIRNLLMLGLVTTVVT